MIRFNKDISGSSLQNPANCSRFLIQQCDFWEIKDGNSALFWCDSQYQLPCPKILFLNHIRKLKIKEGSDVIQWGHLLLGTFSVKEAYAILSSRKVVHPFPIQKRIWNLLLWPKLSYFLWLLSHQRILTQDNLLKKVFQVPSICMLCNCHHETINHLLDSYSFTNTLWDSVVVIFRRINRIRGNITDTLQQWAENPFQSKILNNLWELTSGFIVWNTQKECNNRIFKDNKRSITELQELLREICKKPFSP